ncbi:MAG: hypothetical protein J2P26_13945, partial [Nocardiopsaceae bacterium]|nr:hypothetical protein [Nocardiopsaceae bacterium]
MGAVADVTGMASTRLAEAVGYPGSSVAFAQLLSGMERDGLIVREVRGKRTYRITLPEGPGAAQAVPAQAGTGLAGTGLAGVGVAGADLAAAGGPGGFDYDELARRLLVQVLRKLASGSGTRTATVDVPGALAERFADAGSDVDGRGTDGHGADGH